jgi:hypothetical protein
MGKCTELVKAAYGVEAKKSITYEENADIDRRRPWTEASILKVRLMMQQSSSKSLVASREKSFREGSTRNMANTALESTSRRYVCVGSGLAGTPSDWAIARRPHDSLNY